MTMNVLKLDWAERARCRGMNPSEFIPPGDGNKEATTLFNQRAKLICATCPVVTDLSFVDEAGNTTNPCLELGLELNERSGIWGNATPRERRRIRESRDVLR